MLTLPIKKKWYDMILSGEKKEEYREIKPYYTSRFKNAHLYDDDDFLALKKNPEILGWNWILLRNGYSRRSPSVFAKVRLRIGKGRTDWGAEPDVDYYVLEVVELRDYETSGIISSKGSDPE